MSDRVKPLTIKEVEELLLDTGVIYAINALLLHPLGVALSITTEEDGSQGRLEIVRPMDLEKGGMWSFSEEAAKSGRWKLSRWLDHKRDYLIFRMSTKMHQLLEDVSRNRPLKVTFRLADGQKMPVDPDDMTMVNDPDPLSESTPR